MIVNSSDLDSIKSFIKKLYIPPKDSHKGQNGRVLIIGGSSLFHSSSIWAAEIASHFVDLVHYSSTSVNNQIMISLKKKFRNGIVIPRSDLLDYVEEDDAVLVGPGMVREGQEAKDAQDIIKRLIEKFPDKRFVFDAGALQVMETSWLSDLKQPAIVTPHALEFEGLFGKISPQEAAKKYNCIVLFKKIDDLITDGKQTITVKGGNQGLTKGGTGDLLAGLVVSFYTKNDPLTSCTVASYLLKTAADRLSKTSGYWYNIDDIIKTIPNVLYDVTV